MTPTDPAPAVVLDARDGFIAYMQRENPAPEDLFEYLVQHEYVTLKFYVEFAEQYPA